MVRITLTHVRAPATSISHTLTILAISQGENQLRYCVSQPVSVRAHSGSSMIYHEEARESGYRPSLHHWAIEVNEITHTNGKENVFTGSQLPLEHHFVRRQV